MTIPKEWIEAGIAAAPSVRPEDVRLILTAMLPIIGRDMLAKVARDRGPDEKLAASFGPQFAEGADEALMGAIAGFIDEWAEEHGIDILD